MDLLKVRMVKHNIKHRLHHEIGLLCPVCKKRHIRCFVTGTEIDQEELEQILEKELQDFYLKHVLDCKKWRKDRKWDINI